MRAAMLQDNVVVNIIAVNNENFRKLKQKGYNLLASDSLGLEIGDYTEDGTMFYRDIPIYDPETGVQIDTVKKSLPLDTYVDYESYYNTVSSEIEAEK